jgi:acyl dehydratase
MGHPTNEWSRLAMPIDPEAALGAIIPPFTSSWDADDVILYHLGIGAGLDKPTDAAELAYTYEQRLAVLPSFGVVPAFPGLVLAATGQVPGLAVNPVMILHGEQDLEIHRPIPTSATVEHRPRVASVYDKVKAALITIEVESGEVESGEVESGEVESGEVDSPLFTNRFTIFARGEGGFGGHADPPAPGNEPPDRAPDAVAESPTMSHQALLYRLSGDKNPLHADPDFAKLGGFDTPILHGLCTYGIACKAVVDTLLDGDVAAVARYRVRFTGVVFPGETVVTSMWREGERIVVSATTKERGKPVLSNAAIWTR